MEHDYIIIYKDERSTEGEISKKVRTSNIRRYIKDLESDNFPYIKVIAYRSCN